MDAAQLKKVNLFEPTEEHQMLRSSVRSFVRAEVEPKAAENDRREYFDLDLFHSLAKLGLLGVTVPEQYGGAGMDVLAAVIVHEEIAASDPGFCLAYLAHSMLCVNNICVNASEEQKKRVLPKLCSGEWIGAMGMSEPAVGTDVLGMQTRADKKGDHYILNGRKMWITNGVIDDKSTPCHCLLVYARTGEDSQGKPALSTFLVEQDMQGFSVGQKLGDKLGMRASNTAELCFDNCKVPASHLVGEEGQSLVHMMRNLEIERLTLAAMSVGLARRCINIMVNYANERKAFGKSISKFGHIQKYIGESYAEYMAAKTYLYDIARRMDVNAEGNRLDTDGIKLFAAPVGKRIADNAIQVLGGYGYVGEYVVERLWRDAKLLEIGGGTLESHSKNMCADIMKNIDSFRL